MLGHRGAPITVQSLLRLSLRSARSRSKIGAAVATIISALACGETPSRPTEGASNPMPFTGRLIDYTTGVGLPNTTVWLARVDPRNAAFSATTDASGFFLNVSPGWYPASVDGRPVGRVRVTLGVRGDLFVNGGNVTRATASSQMNPPAEPVNDIETRGATELESR